VYNSASPGAEQVTRAYRQAHPDISDEQVLDLADPFLAGRADVDYRDFITHLRDPIRRFLGASPRRSWETTCILLIHGLPHRIRDINRPALGDKPEEAAREFLDNGNATYASVDSELTLVWQDLERGEYGLSMDSLADNVIANPYHGSNTGIDRFPRKNIARRKVLDSVDDVAWLSDEVGTTAVTAGDFYMVCRIDGRTTADALALIKRAQHLAVNRARAVVVLDENDVELPDMLSANKELDDDPLIEEADGPDLFEAHDDYEAARDALVGDGWQVAYDDTALFLRAADLGAPLIAYSSYGSNHGHDGSESPILGGAYTRQYDLVRGAIFNTIESYNGRAINGLSTLFDQGQLADFIAVGGSFGIGHVYEPFSFAVPDNEYLLVNFLVNRMSWAESAWSSIPVLSWQHIVLGDPLARVEQVVDLSADLDADGDVDLVDFATFQNCFSGFGLSVSGGCGAADFDGDHDVDLSDFAAFSLEFTGSFGP
jgi:hypothetical protein